MTSKHPIDFDSLSKGDLVTIDQLRDIFSDQTSPEMFAFACLALKDRIECETDIICKQSKAGIHLLTDAEADLYTADQTRVAVKKLGRQAVRRTMIDRGKMTPDEKRAAEARDRMVAGVAAAAKKAMRTREKMTYNPATGSLSES